MRTPLRVGAATAVGLGVLLLATVLASPALAWQSNVTVNARCPDGQLRVNYTVQAWETGHEATVDVSYELNGVSTKLPSGRFRPDDDRFSGHIDLPAGTTGTVTVTAVAHWKGGEKSTNKGSDELPPADKCAETSPTTSTAPPTTAPPTTAPPTTAPPTSAPQPTVAPSTSPPTTDDGAVGGATSTTSGGGQLPFTGASSGPMLLAGIALVGGGVLFLLLSRTRSRHAAR